MCLYAQNMTMHACTCLPPQGVNQPMSHLTNRSTLAVKMLSTERADDATFGVYSHRLGACPRCIASTLRAVMRGTLQQLLRTHTNVHASALALMPVPSYSPPPFLLHHGSHAPHPATQRTQETRGWVGAAAYTMHPPPAAQRTQEMRGWWGARPTLAAPCSGSTSRTSSCGS